MSGNLISDKPHVKGMFVSKYVGPVSGRACRSYDVGILSDDDRYIEYSFIIGDESRGLTKGLSERFRYTFNQYAFDSSSHVCFLDTIRPDSPLLIWARTFSMQAGFCIRRRTMEQVLRRISYECHTYVQEKKKKGIRREVVRTKDIGMKNLLAIWRKLCRTRRCPWITVELDKFIRQRCDHEAVRRRQYVRLGTLYLAFVAYRLKHSRRFKARLRAGLVGTPENQEKARAKWAEAHPDKTIGTDQGFQYDENRGEDIVGTIMEP